METQRASWIWQILVHTAGTSNHQRITDASFLSLSYFWTVEHYSNATNACSHNRAPISSESCGGLRSCQNNTGMIQSKSWYVDLIFSWCSTFLSHFSCWLFFLCSIGPDACRFNKGSIVEGVFKYDKNDSFLILFTVYSQLHHLQIESCISEKACVQNEVSAGGYRVGPRACRGKLSSAHSSLLLHRIWLLIL